MKKVIVLVLVFAICLTTMCLVVSASDAQIAMESGAASAGEQITLDISISGNTGVAYLKLKVAYDSDVLTLASTENTGLLEGTYTTSKKIDTNPYILQWMGAGNSIGDGVIVTLTFDVADTAVVGEYEISILLEECYDEEYEDVIFDVSSGVVTVKCAHAHTETTDKVPPTCVQSGFTAGVYCNDCQTYISGHEEIPATGEHSDADGKWNYDEDGHYCVCECGLMYAGAPHSGGNATCTTKAVCDICHVEYGNVDASAHGQTEVRNASEAVCNQEGYTGDTYCLDCGEMISAGSVIPATGKHTGGEATCNEQAVCELCGTVYGELAADNHGQTEIRGAVEATCGNAGFTGDVYCMDCGKVVEAGSMIGATGDHTDNDGDELCDDCGADLSCKHTGGEATCTQQAVCEICGAAYGKQDANNHGETEIKGAVEATCGNAGFSGDVCCADCGEVIEAGSMIAATGEHTDADEDSLCDDCGAELPKDEEPSEVNPGMGDAMLVWFVLIIACSAIAVACAGKKKYMA